MTRSKLGMTLLELLVALALLAAISTALLSATGMGIRGLERAQETAEYDDSTLTRLQLRRWLRSAASPALLTPIDTDFFGTSAGFEFTTFLPSGHAPEAAALRITVEIMDQTLVVHIDALDDQSEIVSDLTRELALGASNVSIMYLANHADGATWLTEWNTDLQLPLAVKIETQEGNVWPFFFVRLPENLLWAHQMRALCI